MKKLIISLNLLFVLLCISGCDSDCDNDYENNSTLLASPIDAESLSYNERNTDSFNLIYDSVNDFNSSFSYNAYSYYDKDDNFCVSPLSIYMILAISSACAEGNTKIEILNALNISEEELNNGFDLLYRSINVTKTDEDDKIYSVLDSSNSLWINDGIDVSYSNSFIQKLASNYYCYSYKADFLNDNKNANYAIKEFVKEQTRDLIDVNFNISPDVLFSLVNCLYLKDIWNIYGSDIKMTTDKYDFIESNGNIISKEFIDGNYFTGRVYEGTNFKSFYTKTYSNYKIKFIVPTNSASIEEVFTEENISLVNSITNYNSYDSEKEILYKTRCIFPEYEASYDEYIDEILNEKYNISDLFDDNCDFSNLFDSSSIQNESTKIRHITDLKVDRTGIEGAAVTIEMKAGSAEPVETVYEDFVVDRAFGFIITDSYDMPIFTGIVNEI